MCTHTHTQMGTKTISLMDDAYDLLSRAKLPNESFSDTVRRITSPNESIMEFFGVWDKKFGEDVLNNIKDNRDANKKREETD